MERGVNWKFACVDHWCASVFYVDALRSCLMMSIRSGTFGVPPRNGHEALAFEIIPMGLQRVPHLSPFHRLGQCLWIGEWPSHSFTQEPVCTPPPRRSGSLSVRCRVGTRPTGLYSIASSFHCISHAFALLWLVFDLLLGCLLRGHGQERSHATDAHHQRGGLSSHEHLRQTHLQSLRQSRARAFACRVAGDAPCTGLFVSRSWPNHRRRVCFLHRRRRPVHAVHASFATHQELSRRARHVASRTPDTCARPRLVATNKWNWINLG